MKMFKLSLSAVALVLGMLFSLNLHAEDDNLRLNLICEGSGSARKTETTYINQYDSNTKKYNRASAQTSSKQPFDGIVEVKLSDGSGKIKLPDQMVPPLNAGDDGWFKIHDLVVNSRKITGSIKINFLNSQQLRIDRRSGLLTIDGGGSSFSGRCSAVDEDSPRKF